MEPHNVLPALWAKWYFDNISGKTVGGGSKDSAYAEAVLQLSKVYLATAKKYRVGKYLLMPDFDIVSTGFALIYVFRLYLIKNGRKVVTDIDIRRNTLILRAEGFEEKMDFTDAMCNGATLESEYDIFVQAYGTKHILRNKMRFKPEYNHGWIT